jgi:tetratricopeptide (TPR) repeat protein
MRIPDWRNLGLTKGVLPEPGPEANRLVVWVPGRCAGRFRHWERVSSVARAEIFVAEGLCLTAATSLPARQRVGGFWGKLWSRFAPGHETPTWLLPGGGSAEQCGQRQTGLLLVWAEHPSAAPDETGLRARWPESNGVRRLGDNLFLVSGVGLPKPAAAAESPAPPPGCPRQQAGQLLAAARQRGDRPGEATALTDLGVVLRREGEAAQARALLEEALALARELGDLSRERDALGNLGLAHLAAGQAPPALACFEQELAMARAAGDPFAHKSAWEHLGWAHLNRRDFPQARACLEQALALARAAGDRPHEADLLWYLAIGHAEQGRRGQAIAHAQAAVDLLRQGGKPQARTLADHLEKYRRGESGGGLRDGADVTGGAPPGVFMSEVIVASAGPASQAGGGPGLLRMALSAVQALTRYLGSGCRTVAAPIHRQRLASCAACEHHTGVRCLLCGCFTGIKAWLPHEECPLGKWPA